MDHSDSPIIVIGAGAAGLVAAASAARAGASVLLLEKTAHAGNKLAISGKNRCNLTNAASLDEFIAMYGPNGRFLRSAFHRFFRDELLELLCRYGVPTKVERGGRVFPVSDDARDVIGALLRCTQEAGVVVRLGAPVRGIQVSEGRVTGVETVGGAEPCRAAVLATGGCSYPRTGSSGDGYRMAAELGHTIVDLRPALIPLAVEEVELAKSMQGVSLRNVRLTAFACKPGDIDSGLTPSADTGRGVAGKRPKAPIIESRLGEMIFTHFGVGGPITLLESLAVVDALKQGPVSLAVDLKPGLGFPQLDARLQRDLATHGKRGLRRLLTELLPAGMVEPYVTLSGIAGDKLGNQITAEERARLVGLLKCLRFSVTGALPITSAIVTAGGVRLKDVDPLTMESRLVQGLYFAGEVLDLDADTGGYNLQAAFSTGYVAGESAGQKDPG